MVSTTFSFCSYFTLLIHLASSLSCQFTFENEKFLKLIAKGLNPIAIFTSGH